MGRTKMLVCKQAVRGFSMAGRRLLCSAVVVKTEALQTAYPAPAVGTVCPVFKSDAEARIAAVPAIEVHGSVAKCDGGGGPMGHPLEFIQLNTKRGGPAT